MPNLPKCFNELTDREIEVTCEGDNPCECGRHHYVNHETSCWIPDYSTRTG